MVEFTDLQAWIGVDFPGSLRIELFSNDQLIYTSSEFLHAGVGFFAGLRSDQLVGAARIFDPLGGVAIDDLHFGVPAPGPLALFGLSALLHRGGRRRAAPGRRGR